MPIYEFECGNCGARVDELMRVSDPDPVTCPKCGKDALHRRLSAPSFRLAGSGWYETDFKSDKDKKRNLAESGGGGDAASSGASGKSDGAKSEATPAAKSDASTASSSSTSSATGTAAPAASKPSSSST